MPELPGISPQQPVHEFLRVWDEEEMPETTGLDLMVLWRHSVANNAVNQISIARIVEDRADTLRSRYLAWIHDLGQSTVDGRRVIDHLVVRPGLSFWWMTSLAQKFNLGSYSGIHDTIKVLALEELIVERSVSVLRLYSKNAALAECLASLCHRRDISFSWSRPAIAKRQRFFERLPAMIRALAYLLWYLLKVLPLFMRRPVIPVSGGVMFMDVLVHLDRQAIAKGFFASNYWTGLVSRLEEWKVSCIWGHLFFSHPEIRTPAIAARLLDLFNQNALVGQGHFLLEAYIRPKHFLAALRDYWLVSFLSRRLHAMKHTHVPGSVVDPWPLHRQEWEDSVYGKEAFRNCLRIVLFEAVMSTFPKQRMGIYIFENQPWELAFLHAWRVSGHGEIIGIPHTTVRFWDLRYHHDPRCYETDLTGLGRPLPDRLAVNGPMARESLLASGYSEERLSEVEALRFIHLQAPPDQRQMRSANSVLRVLVCGDFLDENNAHLFSWLEVASKLLPTNTKYMVKPHPAFPIEQRHYPSLSFDVRLEPIQYLLEECDVVFTSNITSAAVDAFCAGVPVVQMMNGRAFNMSPLRGQPGVVYIDSPEALAEALVHLKAPDSSPPKLFNFDPGLVRWRHLLHTERSSQI